MKDGPLVLAAFTKTGTELAAKLAKKFQGRAFAPERCLENLTPETKRDLEPMNGPVSEWAGYWFPRAGAMIFVCACGIAVRAVAPHVKAKTEDPAVLVLDERGRFVIPVLSGHVGGANDLARRVAACTGGEPVITTATDVNGLVAVDEWAVKNNCAIENPPAIKHVSGEILEHHSVGVAVTEQLQPAPWPVTLWLRPRVLFLGAGCKKGTDAGAMQDAADGFLADAGVSPLSLCAVASIDLKSDEPALIALAKKFHVPFITFSADELRTVPGRFSSSERVLEVTGVDNVCERSAVLAALKSGSSGGVLLRSKTLYPGMTFALARKN